MICDHCGLPMLKKCDIGGHCAWVCKGGDHRVETPDLPPAPYEE